jgi:hypothetical protein
MRANNQFHPLFSCIQVGCAIRCRAVLYYTHHQHSNTVRKISMGACCPVSDSIHQASVLLCDDQCRHAKEFRHSDNLCTHTTVRHARVSMTQGCVCAWNRVCDALCYTQSCARCADVRCFMCRCLPAFGALSVRAQTNIPARQVSSAPETRQADN